MRMRKLEADSGLAGPLYWHNGSTRHERGNLLPAFEPGPLDGDSPGAPLSLRGDHGRHIAGRDRIVPAGQKACWDEDRNEVQ